MPHGRWASRCVVSSNKCSFDSFFPFLNHRDRVKRHSSMQCEGFSSLTNGQRANDVKWKVREAKFWVVTVCSWRLSRNRRQLSPQTPHAEAFQVLQIWWNGSKKEFWLIHSTTLAPLAPSTPQSTELINDNRRRPQERKTNPLNAPVFIVRLTSLIKCQTCSL